MLLVMGACGIGERLSGELLMLESLNVMLLPVMIGDCTIGVRFSTHANVGSFLFRVNSCKFVYSENVGIV